MENVSAKFDIVFFCLTLHYNRDILTKVTILNYYEKTININRGNSRFGFCGFS